MSAGQIKHANTDTTYGKKYYKLGQDECLLSIFVFWQDQIKWATSWSWAWLVLIPIGLAYRTLIEGSAITTAKAIIRRIISYFPDVYAGSVVTRAHNLYQNGLPIQRKRFIWLTGSTNNQTTLQDPSVTQEFKYLKSIDPLAVIFVIYLMVYQECI